MGMIPLDLNPSPKKLRQFGWMSPIMLLALALVLRWRFSLPMSGVLVFGLIGLVIFIVSRISVRLIRPVYQGLVLAGYPIGWVVGHLLMILFYYGIITPLALVFRLFGRDVLSRRWEPERDTYWTEHPQSDTVERYFRQF